jgi:peptidylprolyl isomerase/FKBP-type peptidyl-prolyl cis-trans isomerase FklB
MKNKVRLKKYGFYWGLVLVALLFTACSEDEVDLVAEAWKRQNDQAFIDISRNPEFTELNSPGNNGSIYYRVIQKGEGKRVFYTSRVEVYYKGWFVVTNADRNIKDGDVFDQKLFDDGVTAILAVSEQAANRNIGVFSVIEGWSAALQHMVEGDKWEIWVPYQLGYGKNGSDRIPGYSTLAFEIELVRAIDRNMF